MLNITNIPAPRVEVIDPRTGLMAREWYRFFLNLFLLTGGGTNNQSITDLLVAPLPSTDTLSLSQQINDLATQPVADNANAEIEKQINALAATPDGAAILAQIAQMEKELNALKMQVQPQLGTMAALQQNNLPWVQFDTTPQHVPTGAAANGTLYWDDADSIKTLNLVMEDTGEVVQHIGEETYYRIKAASPITDGQVVMFAGTVGASGGLIGAPATGLTATQNELIMGIATQNIATNGWGYVTWFGEVKKINTTGSLYGEVWADGDILYYNPAVAGGLTKNVPAAPNPKVIVAAVVHAATNGILFVRPTFGSALGATDSNVQITGLANGDILQYVAANNRWENTPLSTAGVTSFSAGTTGLTPNSPTTGAVVLGGTLDVDNGGTGQTTYTDGQLLIGNSTGNTLTKATLTAGTGITITNGSGSISIATTLSAPVTKTADFTVAASETWIINNKSGSTCTVTLPTASANTGRTLTFQNYQAQLLVSASSDVVPLGGGSAGTAILDAVVGNWATMVSDGTNWVVMQDAPNNALLIE